MFLEEDPDWNHPDDNEGDEKDGEDSSSSTTAIEDVVKTSELEDSVQLKSS